MEFLADQLSAAGAISAPVYLLVLLAGVASALSPCFVPVLALFGGYIGGYTAGTAASPPRLTAAFTLGQALVWQWSA